MEQLAFETFLNGLQFGVFLFLVSAGLTLVLGIMSMVNLVHGSMFMMGAYFASTIFQATDSFLLAIVAAIPLTLMLGVLLEFVALRTLYARDHLDQVLATFGGILFFNQLVLVVFGAESQEFNLPESIDHPMTLYMSVVLVVMVIMLFLMATMINGIPFRQRPGLAEEESEASFMTPVRPPVGRLVSGTLFLGIGVALAIAAASGALSGGAGMLIFLLIWAWLGILILFGTKRSWSTTMLIGAAAVLAYAIYVVITGADIEFSYPSYRIYVIVAGLAVAIGLYLVISRTKVGMLIRAGASNRTMVSALGVNIILLFTLVFGIGAALAGFAGTMIGPIESVEAGMGEEKLILAFVVIVIGGIGSIRGAFIASIIIGIVEIGGRIYIRDLMEQLMSSDFAQTAGPALASMLIYILMAAVLLFKPEGLFPARTG
jgi:branched-subunit amino acid ABC-type transport system permease component